MILFGFEIIRVKRTKSSPLSGSSSNELDNRFLFDFRKGYLQTGSFVSGSQDSTIMMFNDESALIDPSVVIERSSVVTVREEEKEKVVITPRQVLEELEVTPTPLDLINLNAKLFILKQKRDLVQQIYTKRELSALIERLENRKKYKRYLSFFNSFPNTDDNKIEVFLEKHKFVIKESDIFIPELPDEAIKIMSEYQKRSKKISKKEPVFYIIAREQDFKKAFKKRDPILLVQSPFGFFWQILGAWDKEMLLLNEL